MHIEQRKWNRPTGWDSKPGSDSKTTANLVLIFGARELIADRAATQEVQAAYPCASIVGCSTAGTIAGTEVGDDFLSITAISFEKTSIRLAEVNLSSAADIWAPAHGHTL